MVTRGHPNWKDNTITLLQGPGYYDEPEGQDPIGKVWGLSKYAIAFSLGISALDSLYVTQIVKPIQFAQNFGYWCLPMTGLAATFSSVTYMSTNMRGKDDRLNYVIGAASCAPILYGWKKTTSFTLYGTAILIAAAFLKKDSVMSGWRFYTPPDHQHSYFQFPNMSLVKEWPKRPL